MALDWIPLTDYSTKYKVSISTLRRRIKTEEIKFSFADGKYLIFDEPISAHQSLGRPSRPSPSAHSPSFESYSKTLMSAQIPSTKLNKEPPADEPILTAANKLLNELKRAYTQILQEKEEQILQLNAEISDLKTLVRVLESENQRLVGY